MTLVEPRPGVEDYLLEPDEFARLGDREQRLYLELLRAVLEEVPPFELEPKQQLAEELTGFCDELLYGGAAGGGKSAWLITHQHGLAVKHAGHRGLHLRSTDPEIKMSTLPDAILFYATVPEDERPAWRASLNRWVYPNGSWVQYGHLAEPSHVYRYLSTAWDLITLDELTEFSDWPYRLLTTRARNTEAKARQGIFPHVVGASNPGGKGHGWVMGRFPLSLEGRYGPDGEPGGVEVLQRRLWSPVKQEWQDVEAYLRRVEVKMPDESVEHRTLGFVRSTVLDNPHQSRDYIRNLASQGEVTRRQYLEGDWTVFEGQFFDEFRVTKLVGDEVVPWHVIEPFEIPRGWYRAHAVDHGFAHPFACLWAAWDSEGRMYLYQEANRAGLTPTQQAEVVLSMMPVERSHGIGDPHMWSKMPYQSGDTIAVQWAKAGLRLGKAQGWTSEDRIAGWQKIRDYLLPMETLVDGEAAHRPALVVMSSCPELIRTLPLQVFDDLRPEDLEKNDDDNLVDCLRYLCMHRPRRVKVPEKPLPAGLQGRAEAAQRAIAKAPKRKNRRPGGMM